MIEAAARPFAAVLVMAMGFLAVPGQSAVPANLRQLEELLSLNPPEGHPLRAFEAYQAMPGASGVAERVLGDRGKSAQWSNAIFALGVIGDRQAKARIDRFLREPTDPLNGTTRLSVTTFEVKIDCLFALGYMALHSKDDAVRREAEAYLDQANGTTSAHWRELRWKSPYHATEAARNRYLTSKVRRIEKTLEAAKAARAAAGRSAGSGTTSAAAAGSGGDVIGQE